MAYIGNARTPLIFASNVRDDLLPVKKEDNTYENRFVLSQEVPGGYENNVLVIRKRIVSDPIVASTDFIQLTQIDTIDGRKCYLSTTDDFLAAALNVVQPPTAEHEGDSIKISNAAEAANNGTFKVLSKMYLRNSMTFELASEDIVNELAFQIALTRVYYAPWEILDAEKDYIISGSLPNEYNRVITLTEAPQEGDIVYVLHRGDATYNFVPSPNSVGPDQLSHNLRNFFCDRFQVTDPAGQDTFTLNQEAVSSRAILVTLNGQLTDGDDSESGFLEGQWQLLEDGVTLKFKTPVAENSLVKVLHLGFSTVSRRSSFVVGQEPLQILDGSVTTSKLASECVISSKLANNSVQNRSIGSDAVSADKILLQNNTFLRALSISNTPVNIVGVDIENNVKLSSPNNQVHIWGNSGVYIKNGSAQTDKIVVTPDGKIGLNATDPSTDVEISGKVKISRLTQETDEYITLKSVSGGHLFSTYSSASTPKGLHIHIKTDENNTPVTTTTPYLAASVSILDNQFVQVMSDGKLGLGKTPTTTLDVDGTVKATNIETPTINGMSIDSGFGSSPTGTVVMTVLDAAPSGWLLCDGTEYRVSDYPDLAAAVGNKFGSPSSSLKFKVPDLRKRVAIGADVVGGEVVQNQVGANEGLLVENRRITHKHSGPVHTHDMSHTHSIPPHIHEIVAGTTSTSQDYRSTLAISTSGNHNTSLLHTHTNITGTSDQMETVDNIDGYKGYHYHKIELDATLTNLKNHTHSTTVSGVDNTAVSENWSHAHFTSRTTGEHSHTVNGGTRTGDGGNRILLGSITNSRETTIPYDTTNPDGAHTHSITILQSDNLNHTHTVSVGNSTTEALNHNHSISGFTGTLTNPSSSTKINDQKDRAKYNSSEDSALHKHLLKFPSTTVKTTNGTTGDSTSDGRHTHATSSFSGAIGFANIKKKLSQQTLAGQTTSNLLTLQDVEDLSVGTRVFGTTLFQGQSARITAINGNVVTLDKPVLINVAAQTELTMSHASGNATLSTTTQSVSNTGPATPADTGEASAPYLILNFIIKT